VSPEPSSSPAAVLVADDDEYVRAMLSQALGQAGFRPLLAADGHKAVELFRRHKDEVRAVLLDVNMPGLDGPGALAETRRADLAVPCCFMTGYSDRYAAEDLMALGAVCVFTKPFHIDDVLETLRDLCGRTR
jgi:DNA-binding NtrC family response regulator